MAREHGPLHAEACGRQRRLRATGRGAEARMAGGGRRPESLGRLPGGRGGAARVAWTAASIRLGARVPAPLAPERSRGGGWPGVLGNGPGRVARGPADTVYPGPHPGAHGLSAIWRGVGLRGVLRVARRRAGRSVARQLARLLPEPRLFSRRAPPPARPPAVAAARCRRSARSSAAETARGGGGGLAEEEEGLRPVAVSHPLRPGSRRGRTRGDRRRPLAACRLAGASGSQETPPRPACGARRLEGGGLLRAASAGAPRRSRRHAAVRLRQPHLLLLRVVPPPIPPRAPGPACQCVAELALGAQPRCGHHPTGLLRRAAHHHPPAVCSSSRHRPPTCGLSPSADRALGARQRRGHHPTGVLRRAAHHHPPAVCTLHGRIFDFALVMAQYQTNTGQVPV